MPGTGRMVAEYQLRQSVRHIILRPGQGRLRRKDIKPDIKPAAISIFFAARKRSFIVSALSIRGNVQKRVFNSAATGTDAANHRD